MANFLEPMDLKKLLTAGSAVSEIPGGWRLSLPAGPAGRYRVAQLYDYQARLRRRFPWQEGTVLALRMRASANDLPGTWGAGLWNDPFGLGIMPGGGLRLPALPNAAWFFFASPPNYLSLRDDLAAQGALAATFASPRAPAALLAPGLLGAPLLWLRPVRGGLRRLGRSVIRQDSCSLSLDPTEWHVYRLEWRADHVRFWVDEQEVFRSRVAPRGRLGLVIWIDNQYAAFPPDGRLAYGTLANPAPAWIEVTGLACSTG